MLNLKDLFDKHQSDKNTAHSYADVYTTFFNDMRNNPISLLEIGIYKGGSLKAWHDYFVNGTIYGIDKNPVVIDKKEYPRCITHLANATSLVKMRELFGQIQFDIIIDDGSHKFADQLLSFYCLYSLLKPNGYYIIEDVQGSERFKDYLPNVFVIDRRSVKNRSDDVLVVYRKVI